MQVLRERIGKAPWERVTSDGGQLLVLVSVLAASFILPPMDLGIPLCLFHAATGLPCPGCGLTRSFVAISHGRFLQSLAFNQMGPALFGFLLILLANRLFRVCGCKPPFASAEAPAAYYLIGAGLILTWVLRVAL